MATYRYKEIKTIMENTPVELDGKNIEDENVFAYGDRYMVGTYRITGNNWTYRVYIINYNGYMRPVVTSMGYIISHNGDKK